ncbi:MAG TPA: hypothetical protein PK874_14170 [Desulfobacteraceae bacterium]|nr:hypothetical protein [Desulfobacteraceae bacterium]HPJ67056.1 hypothetical protein [Desulfobacteraceae bacterium]HPQ27104.1 hypothetical protein [Desulfobacteraceae bacterium]
MNYPAPGIGGILKSIEHPKGLVLVRRVYGGLVCLLPAFGWLAD